MKIEFTVNSDGIQSAVLNIDAALLKKQKIYFPPTEQGAKIELRRSIAGTHGFWTAEKMIPAVGLPASETTVCPALSIIGEHDRISFRRTSVPELWHSHNGRRILK